MRRLLRFIIKIVLVIAVVVIAIGSYIGNVAYTEFREAPWDSLLGIENHAKDVSVIDHWEEERGWEKVWVTDPDGHACVARILKTASLQTRPLFYCTVSTRIVLCACLTSASIAI